MAKFRPSSGHEFDMFYASFCRHCQFEKEYRKSGVNGCEIIAKTMIMDVEDNEYPKEWVYKNGIPYCTAYTDNVVPIRCDKTVDMFGGG